MAHDAGHEHSSDGPTCLVAILTPFLVVCAIVGYVTLDRGGITQRDEETGLVQVLTWHGWAPAGEPARQLSEPQGAAYGEERPVVVGPTAHPAPPAALAAPNVGDAAPTPEALADSGNTSQSAGYGAVDAGDPAPAAPAAAAGLSPWTVLGWILVVLVPLVLVTGTALVVYRHLSTSRRRPGPGGASPVAPVGTLSTHVVGETAAGPAQPAAGPQEGSAPPAAPESTYIADFLGAERVPEALAIGGTHDAPVYG